MLWTTRIPFGSVLSVEGEIYALEFYNGITERVETFLLQFPFVICELLVGVIGS